MISKETNKPHQKHAKLTRPNLGEFGRNEIAIVGTTCAAIKSLAYNIINQLTAFKVAYADADHKSAEEIEVTATALSNGGFLEYTDKLSFQRLDLKRPLNGFEKHTLFNEQDLIIINGNHFTARSQIVVIDPVKDLDKKADQLTDVRLILIKDEDAIIPDFLKKLPGFNSIEILSIEDKKEIKAFVEKFLSERMTPLNGLVLSGGVSSRMKKDKGSLSYHGVSQREYLYKLLSQYCENTFVSCNSQQAEEIGDKLPIIEDTFLNLGPIGGILSAFQFNPNAAWLIIACDLPHLTKKTIECLIDHRNPSKNATAFLDPGGEFPEPLVAIWEPKSYLPLLQFLAQGYSCPRKALINSDVQLLKAPDEKEFLNANLPEQYEQALMDLKTKPE